jgi:hypothetical protein
MTSPDPFEDQLRNVLASQANVVTESRIAAIADRDYAPRTRRRAIPLLCAGVVATAAAVAAVVIVPLPAHDPSPGTVPDAAGPVTGSGVTDSPASESNWVELGGYRLSFPAGYQLGRADTNCTKDLHLSATEIRRLVTTPEPGCPLLVTSVVRSLPTQADRVRFSETHHIGSGAGSSYPDKVVTATIYLFGDGTTHVTTYVPAKLPDGSTVYVTVAGPPAGLDVRGSGRGPAYSLAQLVEFEQGVDVSRG